MLWGPQITSPKRNKDDLFHAQPFSHICFLTRKMPSKNPLLLLEHLNAFPLAMHCLILAQAVGVPVSRHWSTGKNVCSHYKRHYHSTPLPPSSSFLFFQIPSAILGPLAAIFDFVGIAGGERVPPAPLDCFFYKNNPTLVQAYSRKESYLIKYYNI